MRERTHLNWLEIPAFMWDFFRLAPEQMDARYAWMRPVKEGEKPDSRFTGNVQWFYRFLTVTVLVLLAVTVLRVFTTEPQAWPGLVLALVFMLPVGITVIWAVGIWSDRSARRKQERKD